MKTECDTAIPRVDSPILDQLADETARLACGTLGDFDIHQVCSDPNGVRFRLADGRMGTIELLVNWDVINDALHDVTAIPTRLAAPA
jgi:uncharacterized protein YwbE